MLFFIFLCSIHNLVVEISVLVVIPSCKKENPFHNIFFKMFFMYPVFSKIICTIDEC